MKNKLTLTVKYFINLNPSTLWICTLDENGEPQVVEYQRNDFGKLALIRDAEVQQYYEEEGGFELWIM